MEALTAGTILLHLLREAGDLLLATGEGTTGVLLLHLHRALGQEEDQEEVSSRVSSSSSGTGGVRLLLLPHPRPATEECLCRIIFYCLKDSNPHQLFTINTNLETVSIPTKDFVV